jgi:hypothetical protein
MGTKLAIPEILLDTKQVFSRKTEHSRLDEPSKTFHAEQMTFCCKDQRASIVTDVVFFYVVALHLNVTEQAAHKKCFLLYHSWCLS